MHSAPVTIPLPREIWRISLRAYREVSFPPLEERRRLERTKALILHQTVWMATTITSHDNQFGSLQNSKGPMIIVAFARTRGIIQSTADIYANLISDRYRSMLLIQVPNLLPTPVDIFGICFLEVNRRNICRDFKKSGTECPYTYIYNHGRLEMSDCFSSWPRLASIQVPTTLSNCNSVPAAS